MHTIIHKLKDGGVGNYSLNPDLVALMMATGTGYSESQIANDVKNFTQPLSEEATLAGKIAPSLALATEWATATAKGRLTYAEVLDLFTRWISERRGYTESLVIEAEELPSYLTGDRYFRDALVWDDTESCKCKCDMPKARTIHMDKIRAERNKELAAKDITFMRAVEAGDTDAQATIGTEKQVLRDIPAT